MANNKEKENKWREEFEAWEDGRKDKRLDELENKYNNKTITREENDEYQKMLKIDKNIEKVEHISDYIDRLSDLKEQIIKEISARRQRNGGEGEKAQEATKKLEEELPKLLEEDEKLSKQLKNPNLSKEEKEEISKKRQEIKDKISQNNAKYSKYTGIIAKSEKQKQKEVFSEMGDKELFDNAVKVSAKISVANLYAKQLMDGQQDLSRIEDVVNKQNIETKQGSLRSKVNKEIKRYRATAENKEKIDNVKNAVKGKDLSKEGKAQASKIEKEEEIKRAAEVSKALTEVSEFDQKHPKLAAIKNWFKNGFKKIKDSMSYENPNKEESNKEKSNKKGSKKEEKAEASIEDKRKEFMRTLKEMDNVDMKKVAENGQTRQDPREILLRNKLMKENQADSQTIDKLTKDMDEETVNKIKEDVKRQQGGDER